MYIYRKTGSWEAGTPRCPLALETRNWKIGPETPEISRIYSTKPAIFVSRFQISIWLMMTEQKEVLGRVRFLLLCAPSFNGRPAILAPAFPFLIRLLKENNLILFSMIKLSSMWCDYFCVTDNRKIWILHNLWTSFLSANYHKVWTTSSRAAECYAAQKADLTSLKQRSAESYLSFREQKIE